MSATNKRYFAVVNPVSGGGKTRDRFATYKRDIEARVGGLSHAFTKGSKDATTLTQKALDEGFTEIISIGGDGTHHEVVNGFFRDGRLINDKATLYPFTSGTGSDFLRTLKAHFGLRENTDIFASDRVERFNVGAYRCVNQQGADALGYFFNILDMGFGASVCDAVNNSSKRLGGFFSFFLGCLKTLANHKNATVSVGLDGKWHTMPSAFMGVVANGSYFGGGMHIAPGSVPTQEGFAVHLFDGLSVLEILKIAPSIYAGTHIRHPKVSTHRSHEVELRSPQRVPVEADGEFLGYLPLGVKVLPKAIRVKVP